MNTLITICCRQGSKGLPGKTTKLLHGKPLWRWTEEKALEWGEGRADICISTDSFEVMQGVSDGVSPFERPEKLCQDDTPKLKVIRDAVLWMENEMGKKYDCVIDLDICNPMRTVDDIKQAYRLWKKKEADSVVSVVLARRNPYYNQVEITKGLLDCTDGRIDICCIPTDKSPVIARQDAPTVYDMNNSIFVYTREWLVREKPDYPISARYTLPYEMPDHTFCDIDTDLDFKIVEFLMREYWYT